MKALKKMWIELVLALIGPALEEQKRRDKAREEAFLAEMNEKFKPYLEARKKAQWAEREKRAQEDKAFEVRHAQRKAARAAAAALA